MSKSILQEEKECYITGAIEGDYVTLHQHHIFEGVGRKKRADEDGLWVWLRAELHNASNYSVHSGNNKELDLQLKRRAQRAYEETHSRQSFIERYGKSYL